MWYRQTKKNSGFTLIEAMIACAILAICLAAMGRVMITATRTGAMAERQMEAMHTARAALEELATLSFGAPALAVGTHTLVTGDGFYHVESVDPFTKNIVMHVFWNDPFGSPTNTVSLTTSFSRTIHP